MAGGDGSGEGRDSTRFTYGELARLGPFRRLWLADIASQSADRMAFVAITLLAYGEGSSAWELSSVIGAYFFPAILLGIPGGIAADRLARRSVMVVAEGVRVAIALAMFALGEGWWLIPMVLAFSSLTYLFYPSRQAAIPCLVPERALLPANAAISSNLILGFIIGPPVGGLVAAVADPVWALAVAAGVMATGVALVASIREESVCTPARTVAVGSGRALREGLADLAGRPMVWQGFLLVGVVMFAVGGGAVGLVILGDEGLSMGEEGFTLLLSTLALGTLFGAAFVGARPPDAHKGRLVVLAPFLAGAMLALLPRTDNMALALVLLFVTGIAAAMVLVPFTTLLHEQLGNQVMGTTFGLLSMALTTPMVAGIGVAGLVVDRLGLEGLFTVLGGLLLLVGVAFLATSSLWRGVQG